MSTLHVEAAHLLLISAQAQRCQHTASTAPGLLTLSRVPLTDLYSLLTRSLAAEWRRTLSPLGTQKKLQCLYLSAIIYAGMAAHTRPPYRAFPPLARNNFPTLFPLIPWPSLTNPTHKRTLEKGARKSGASDQNQMLHSPSCQAPYECLHAA